MEKPLAEATTILRSFSESVKGIESKPKEEEEEDEEQKEATVIARCTQVSFSDPGKPPFWTVEREHRSAPVAGPPSDDGIVVPS